MRIRTIGIVLVAIGGWFACQPIGWDRATLEVQAATERQRAVAANGDVSYEVSSDGGTVTFEVVSNVSSSWVDVHFSTSRNPCLENHRLERSGPRWVKTVATTPPLVAGDVVTFFLTYDKADRAYDSPNFVWTAFAQPTPVPSPTKLPDPSPSPSPSPSASPSPIPAAPLVVDNFNSALRWAAKSNSLGKAISTQGGLYNLEADRNLYFFFNGGSYRAEGFTQSIGVDLSPYSDLVLTICGLLGGEQSGLWVVLDDGVERAVRLGDFGLISTSYSTIRIPLTAFGVDRSSVLRLKLEGKGFAQAVRIDEIRFE